MGLGGISLWQLLIILVIVVLIFGTKKLSSMGSGLGGAVKGFRKAMGDEDAAQIDKPDAEFSESAAERTSADENSESKQNS